MNQPTAQRRQRGITLVEAMVTTTICAVLAGAALPSFDQSRQRRHLEGAAAQLETDLQLARSEAVLRGASVRVDFQTKEGASCYVLHTGAAGDCSCVDAGEPVCKAGATSLRSVRFAPGGVLLASNSRSMLFDAHVGTVTPTGTVKVSTADGQAIHQIINITGRVRSCSPALPGYKRC